MSKMKILIVDDGEMNRVVLEGLVENLGHLPVLAENGEQAMELIRQPPLVDLVLLDILMPGLSGYKVLQLIKEDNALRAIPVIMVTVVDELDSVIQCLEAGADDYLIKPFNSQLLKARINGSLEKKRHHDREQTQNARLAESYRKLQEAEEARDSLFRMIVHDIKNPLTTILGEAELLTLKVERGDGSRSQLKSLANIQQGVGQINELVQSILDVSGKEGKQIIPKFEQLELRALLEGVVDQFSAEVARQGGKLLLLPQPGEEVYCRADSMLLRRIIQNLLSNGVKYGCGNENPILIIQLQKQSDGVEILVSDNGTGILEEDLKLIFNKFFQVDKKRKGIGLGLTFCEMAVKSMNGSIKVENNSHAGVTFTLQLPAAHSPVSS